MKTLTSLVVFTALPYLVTAEIGLTAQAFQLAGGSAVNNIKLSWTLASGSGINYTVSRKQGSSGSLSSIGTTKGDSFDDYGLSAGTQYFYQITAKNSSSTVDSSNLANATTFTPQGTYNTYDNTVVSNLSTQASLYANGVYYQYSYQTYSNGSMQGLYEQTSKDGYTFSGNRSVLSGTTVCASVNYSCILQSMTYRKDAATGQFVLWAHLENTENYDLAQVACAATVPGKTFTFYGTYRPLGHDSRDLNFFADTDGSAYLISATNTNTDTNIYKLNSTWTGVSSLTATVMKSDYREGYSTIKQNGWYYIFSSRAAGWYPSTPSYIVSKAMAGPWTDLRWIGNTADFAGQSGVASQLKSLDWVQTSTRWGAQWNNPDPLGDRSYLLPLSLSNTSTSAYANTEWYKMVKYSDNITTPGQGRYGVQTGKIASIGRPLSSPYGGQNISFVNDGTSNDPTAKWIPTQVPFYVDISLESASKVVEVDLTTYLLTGSETYYQFNVSGTNDGKTFTLLADEMNNTVVGFVPTFPTSGTAFNSVRLFVEKVVDVQNGNEDDGVVGVHEVTVYVA